MKNFDESCKLGFRLGLLAIIVIACNLGYVGSPKSQYSQTSNNSNPDITRTDELTATQELTLLVSPTATIPPAGTFSSQLSKAVTIPPATVPPDPLSSLIPPEDIVWGMLGQVNIDRALNDLRQLTGDVSICMDNGCHTITNRLTGSEGLKWAKEYVYKELVNLGYSVEFRDWSRSGRADQNVVARKPGAQHPDEEIYFVAHIDGLRSGFEERFPAADDNASGVVDILELARVLSGYSFSRTVVLLFSTGEEQGTLGVKSYLDQLTPNELSAIKYAINIDMVGYDANQDTVMELWYGDHPPSYDLVTRMGGIIQAYQLDLAPGYVVGCG